MTAHTQMNFSRAKFASRTWKHLSETTSETTSDGNLGHRRRCRVASGFSALVHTEWGWAISHSYKGDRKTPGTPWGMNWARVEHFLSLLFDYMSFAKGNSVGLLLNRWSLCNDVAGLLTTQCPNLSWKMGWLVIPCRNVGTSLASSTVCTWKTRKSPMVQTRIGVLLGKVRQLSL